METYRWRRKRALSKAGIQTMITRDSRKCKRHVLNVTPFAGHTVHEGKVLNM